MSDWQTQFPTAFYMYSLLIAHLNSACNPILYALFNPLFKNGYSNVFRFLREKFKCIKLNKKVDELPIHAIGMKIQIREELFQ